MDCEFKLIFEGQVEGSPFTKRDIVRLLNQRCGLGQILEVEQLIDSAPFTIRRSDEREELEIIGRELKSVGARVLIVEQVKPGVSERSEIPQPKFQSFFNKYTDHLHAVLQSLDVGDVESLADSMLSARAQHRQIFICGNGGSAALASHMATDLAKQRFEDESSLFRVQSLTDNLSWITATANDFGYDKIFVNQLKNLLQPEDLVIAISSSGNSSNVVKAIQYANQRGAETWGIVGFDGGSLMKEASRSIYIPSKKGQYGYMEDAVSILGHILSVYIYERDCERFADCDA